jgi:hypothetical protein
VAGHFEIAGRTCPDDVRRKFPQTIQTARFIFNNAEDAASKRTFLDIWSIVFRNIFDKQKPDRDMINDLESKANAVGLGDELREICFTIIDALKRDRK